MIYIDGPTTETPQWMKDIVPNVKIYFHFHICGKHQGYGCWRLRDDSIHIHSNTLEPVDRLKMVLLHEYAHHLCPKKEGRTYHHKMFWKTVAALYQKHGILEFAKKEESYKSGRKYLELF